MKELNSLKGSNSSCISKGIWRYGINITLIYIFSLGICGKALADCDLSSLGAAGTYDIATVATSFSSCTDTLTIPSGYTLDLNSGTALPSGITVIVVESGGVINVDFNYTFPSTLLALILEDPDGDGGSPSGTLDFDGNHTLTLSSFTQLLIENTTTLSGNPGAAIIGSCSQQVLIFIDSNPYAGCQNPNGQGVCFSFDEVIQAGGTPVFDADIGASGSSDGTMACVDSDFPLSATITVQGADNQFVNDPEFTWTQLSGPGTITFSNDTISNPTASADMPGTYVIRVTAVQNLSIEGCVSLVDITLVTDVVVEILPNIVPTISGGTSVCQFDPIDPEITIGNPYDIDITVYYNINNSGVLSVNVPATGSSLLAQSTAIADTFIYTIDSASYAIDPVCTSMLNISDTIVVDPKPSISGVFNSCVGFTSQLTGTPAGGSWMSLNPAIATVDGAGLVTGVALGMVGIEYTSLAGCKDTIDFDVNNNGILSLTCPLDISTNNDMDLCLANVTIPTVVFGNPCSPSTLSWHTDGATTIGSNYSESGQPNAQNFNVGITTVYLKATDDNSGEELCSFTVTVTDSQMPEITTCPVSRDFTGCDESSVSGPAYSSSSVLSTYALFSDSNNQGDASDNCSIDSVYYIDLITSMPGECPIVISRTWTLKDTSNNEISCVQTLSITPPNIMVTENGSLVVAACQTQDEINTAFANWGTNFFVSGGCTPTITISPNTPTEPDSCGGMTIVTWTVEDECYTTTMHVDTFTVLSPDPVVVTEAGSVEETSCQTQDAIDMAFDTWYNSFSVSGGCNAQFSVDPATAPDSCGGMTIVTWTVSADHCYAQTTHVDTFTVLSPDPVVVTEAGSVEETSCQTQDAIDMAFDTWYNSFSVSGGCNAQFSVDPATAPDSCGGMTIVTWTVSADHCYAQTTHVDTFTVLSPDPVVVTEAGSVEETSCQTQAAIDMAFDTWYNSFSVSGGCNAQFSVDPATAPDSCGGMTIVTWTVSADHCYAQTTHVDTFTVLSPDPVVVTEAGSVEETSCQTQDAIDMAFDTWYNSFSVSGGCNAQFSVDPATAPDSCGGMTIVTWTVSTDHCYAQTTHVDTFTVLSPDPVVVTEAGSVEETSCQTQAAIDMAFDTWYNSFSVSGGCNAQFSVDPATAPDSCGGMTIVTWTVSADHCYAQTTHVDTFTVLSPDPVVVTEAGSVEETSCQTQDAIDMAFDTWYNSFSVSGGCNAQFSVDPATAPDSCGGMTIVTWTVSTDHCYAQTTHVDTFTVLSPDPVVVTEAGSVEETSCQTQDAIDMAFDTWYNSFSVSGGCNAQFSVDPATAPDSCGGMTIVTWTVSADHCYAQTTHVDTFTVLSPDPVVVTEAGSVEETSCQTQDAIDMAFDTWYNSFGVSGGCNAQFSVDPATAPDSCGGMTIVTWTVSADHCYAQTTHVDTFTVLSPDPVVVTEAGSVEETSCQTQDAIDMAFDTWYNSFSVSGGCNAQFSVDPATAPDSCGGMTIVTWTVSADHCYAQTTHVDTFTVLSPDPVVVTEAGSVEETSCQTQSAIDMTFDTWYNSFGVSGGCNAQFSVDPATAPDSCGGMTIVTWTVSADHCYAQTTHVDTFTVLSPDPVVVTEAGSVEETSCQTQAAIDMAFDTWYNSFSVSGGCNAQFSVDPATAPDSCGGMTIVTWTVSADHCYAQTTHVDTFTVASASSVVVTEAGSVEETSCQTQSAIDMTFDTWYNSFGVSGGCNAQFSVDPATAPDSCGGMTIVTWTVSADHCYAQTTHVDTFTVASASSVVVTEAGSVEETSCQTQAAIDMAFDTWYNSFSVSGGCNAQFSVDPATAPDSCGGMTIVTWTVSADHCYAQTTHVDTFTVFSPDPVVVTEAGSVEETSCQTQAAIDMAFDTWYNSFSVSGGCNAQFSVDPATAPDSCGGMTIVTWTVSADHCYAQTTHVDTFTVASASSVVVTEAGSVEETSCQTQAAIDMAFDTWYNSFGVSGGCNAQFSVDPATAPDSCGGMTIVTWTVSADHCYAQTTHVDTFTVLSPDPVVVTEAGSVEETSCQTQAAIDMAFDTWYNSFSVSGGCNAQFSVDPATAPDSCGGMTIVTWTVSADHCYAQTTHVDTFTVASASSVVVTEAGSVEETSCQTQAAIDMAFDTWYNSFSVSGGCNAQFSVDPATAPDSCGGMTIVTWTVSADHCYAQTTHVDTFTVLSPDPVVVTEAGSVEETSCQTQAAIDMAFDTWYNSFSVSGGCNAQFSVDPATAPDSCGGMTIVTWTVSADHCYAQTTHVDTFTVASASSVVVTEAGSVEETSCQTQAAIDMAFDTWYNSFSVSDDCNAQFSVDPATAPDSCGGMTIVTWTVSADHCYAQTTHVDTFTVLSPDPVVVTEAGSVVETSCQTQAAIDMAFDTWYNSFSVSGGCNAQFSVDPATAPDSCGGMTIVTWTVSADHCYAQTTHVDTFTVLSPDPVVVTEAGSVEETSCQTQDAIDMAFDTWYNSFSVSGGCNAQFSVDPATAPDSCGGMTIVTWTVSTDHCYAQTTHVDTFTVLSPDPVVVTEAGSVEETSCQTQDAINMTFDTWYNSFSVSGGCNAQFSVDPATAPDSCGGMTIVTWTVSADHCYAQTTHVDTFTVASANAVVVTEAGSIEVSSCQTQTAINNAFFDWGTNFFVSGGCSPQITISPSTPTPPDKCGGMTIVTWTIEDVCYNTTTHVDTFTVLSPDPVVVTEAGSVEETSCQTQNAIDMAFDAWYNSFSVSGGCNAQFSVDPATAPDSCGGMTIVTWTVSADHCYAQTTHVDTFTVLSPDPVVVTEAGSVEETSCQTQVAIDMAFDTWYNSFSVSGGCNAQFSVDPATAPDSCGGMTIVTWTVSADHCYAQTTHVDTFTVLSPDPVVVTEAGSVEETSCQTQDAIDMAFDTWYNSFSVSGGCNAQFSVDPATAPDSCGGMTIVTWTVSADHCYAQTTHVDTFTVASANAVVVTEAGSIEVSSCQTQTAINNAFFDWGTNFFVSGGCSPQITISPSTPTPPDKCGGMTIVTWTIEDVCYNTTTHVDTFTVLSPDPVVVTEAGSVEETSCQTQDAIDMAFDTWYNSFSVSGGCNAQFSVDPATAPDSCGGMTIVTWTVNADGCYTQTTHVDTFTVASANAVVVTEAGSIEVSNCQTQTAINNAFFDWGTNFFVSGGCSPQITISPSTPTPPDKCGGMTIVTWTIEDACYSTTTHIDTFIVPETPELHWAGNLLDDVEVPTTLTSCDTLYTFELGEAIGGCSPSDISYEVSARDSSNNVISVVNVAGLTYEALFPGGVNEVYVQAMSGCGHMLFDTFTVTIIDTVLPEAICPDQMVLVNIGIDETGTLMENALALGNSLDNCTLTEFSPEIVFTCEDVGINLVNLIATDLSDNKDTIQCPVEVVGTNCPVNLTPNFFPPQAAIFDVDDEKDFVIKVDNTLYGTTDGIIQVFIPYQVGFTFEFLDSATSASTLFGPWPISNTSWDATTLSAGILLTAKPGVTIGNLGSLNFAIKVTADNGGSSGSITANISPTSGGQTDNTDDTKSRNININN